MATENAKITFTTIKTGNLVISSDGTMTVNGGGNTLNVNPIRFNKLPSLCNKRRGGPRSKIKCEVYAEVPHTTHIGVNVEKRNYFPVKYYRWESEE